MTESNRKWSIRGFRLAMAVLAFAVSAFATGFAAESQVKPERLQKLSWGTNLPGWLWLGRGEVPELEQRFSDEYFQTVVSLGLTHVRVPIDMVKIHDESSETLLKKDVLAVLDRGIRKIIGEYKLGVIIDLHSINQEAGGNNYSGQLDSDPKFVETFIRFWGAFAKHLSRYDPEFVYLEAMNEPVFSGKEDQWPPIQKRVMAAIRENAPEHTLITTGAQWSNIHTFVKLEPLEDPNIVYNFHFYEPHTFTHQGASWSSDTVKVLKNIPYPSSPEILQDIIPQYDSEEVQKTLKRYGQERWNKEKIRQEFKLAYDWGQKYGVPLLCNEFGVYQRQSPRESLVTWVKDVREAFDEYGICWTMWTGGFGMMDQRDGKVSVHKDIAEALGLNVK